jgi:hypothetical protein
VFRYIKLIKLKHLIFLNEGVIFNPPTYYIYEVRILVYRVSVWKKIYFEIWWALFVWSWWALCCLGLGLGHVVGVGLSELDTV